MKWVSVADSGHYLTRHENGKILACPITKDGSRATDEEIFECEDQKESLRQFSEALEAENS